MYQRIQDLCHESGTTITALCKKITGSSGNLSTWRNGNIRPEWLSAISDELDVSVDYLLGKTPIKIRLESLNEEEQEFILLLKERDPDFRKSYLELLKASKK